MSQLLDKIKKQSETPAVQMGFRRALSAAATPTILLIAKITTDAAGSPLKNIEGADAVLLESPDMELTAKKLVKIVEPLGETPWGIYLEQSMDTTDALDKTGCDFTVTTPISPIASSPKNEKTGKIIEIESAMDDGLIRAINDLPVDAVLAADSFGDSNTLTYHHLMILRHIAFLVRKPLIVPVPASISKDELEALWNAGIEAVLVPIDITKDENLKKLHDIAVKFPPRKADKQKKMNVFLPRAGEKQSEPPPEEEEEEDE
jgi:hypothetical protein